jgi:hypothetical protein
MCFSKNKKTNALIILSIVLIFTGAVLFIFHLFVNPLISEQKNKNLYSWD